MRRLPPIELGHEIQSSVRQRTRPSCSQRAVPACLSKGLAGSASSSEATPGARNLRLRTRFTMVGPAKIHHFEWWLCEPRVMPVSWSANRGQRKDDRAGISRRYP